MIWFDENLFEVDLARNGTHTFDASRFAFASITLSNSALLETLRSTAEVLLDPDRSKPKVMLLAEKDESVEQRRKSSIQVDPVPLCERCMVIVITALTSVGKVLSELIQSY